ncbi:Glycosyl transferase family 2 [Mesonia phycicola]|uniref:Glycosyl transferase family 2 n=1 Tax=Mesonia phycicola TaxID=579105 RepID=A0A1M6GJ17_9FLAO|nr:glycosyltransferase family A protein [Mesonia phycicola]SHJ09898.1 Glycosyl transferase family 2 [Mesonia phycicola]
MPFFSVVIPLYNKETHIKNTLQDVLDQNFKDFEVIIVNDGSTDKSVSIVEKFTDTRIKLFHQDNQGAAAARNYGIEQASAKHIALLDADDMWKNNHLEEFYKSLQKFPDAGVYCNAYQLKLRSNFTHNASYNLENLKEIQLVKDYFKASCIHPLIMTSGVAFKKQKFFDVGGFDPKIISGQDIDLWIRFALYTEIVFNPKITACYDKTVANSLSKKHLRKIKYEFLNNYKEQENKNPSFKNYLDLNRYAVAIQCKYYNDKEVFQLLKKEINAASLTKKQLFLLNSPTFLVKNLKKLHSYLIEKNIYLTAFK